MSPYVTWLLKDVLPHIVSQGRVVKSALRATQQMIREFDARRREHEERHNALLSTQDGLETLCRLLGATEEQIDAATAERHLCEGVPHAGG